MNKNMENLEKIEETTTQQPLNLHEEPQQQNSNIIFDNILKASLSPMLFNGTFNYESILNNSVLTPPLTPLLLQQAAQLAAAMSTNPSPKSSSPNLSIDIPPSPTEGFTLPWLISSLSSSIDNAQVNTSSDSSSGQSTPRSAVASKQSSHIKRPMNGFMIWAREERRRIVEGSKLTDANSCLHNSQISKILGARWRTLTKEEKAPYFEEQARQKQLHHEKHPDYQYKPKKRRTRAIDGKKITLKEYNEVVKINKSMIGDLDTGYSKTSLETMTHTAFMRIFAPLVSQQPVN